MKSIYSNTAGSKNSFQARLVVVVILAMILLNNCSVLVGQVKPVETKAPKIPFTDVSVISSKWKRLDIQGRKNAEEIPDAAWQSSTSAAVISLNSACRQNPDERVDIKEVTQILLSQWNQLSIISEKESLLSGFPALETEAVGRYLGRDRKFKTVVVKSATCVYDLVYLSPVKTFAQELSIFDRFRDSLNLK